MARLISTSKRYRRFTVLVNHNPVSVAKDSNECIRSGRRGAAVSYREDEQSIIRLVDEHFCQDEWKGQKLLKQKNMFQRFINRIARSIIKWH
ncbi:MAG: hypothetical protein ABF608_13395 [Sporolactobacillus sp.]